MTGRRSRAVTRDACIAIGNAAARVMRAGTDAAGRCPRGRDGFYAFFTNSDFSCIGPMPSTLQSMS